MERSVVKTTKGVVKTVTPTIGAKRGRKKTVASIAARARRSKAAPDYNPLHMLAKLSPF
jgi:hypothetical protein